LSIKIEDEKDCYNHMDSDSTFMNKKNISTSAYGKDWRIRCRLYQDGDNGPYRWRM